MWNGEVFKENGPVKVKGNDMYEHDPFSRDFRDFMFTMTISPQERCDRLQE